MDVWAYFEDFIQEFELVNETTLEPHNRALLRDLCRAIVRQIANIEIDQRRILAEQTSVSLKWALVYYESRDNPPPHRTIAAYDTPQEGMDAGRAYAAYDLQWVLTKEGHFLAEIPYEGGGRQWKSMLKVRNPYHEFWRCLASDVRFEDA